MKRKKPTKPQSERTTAILQSTAKGPGKKSGPSNTVTVTFDEIDKYRQYWYKPGRPRIGEGTRQCSITMERGLVRQLDSYAALNGISRSSVITRAVQLLLKTMG